MSIRLRRVCSDCGQLLAEQHAHGCCPIDAGALLRSWQLRAERAEEHGARLQAINASHVHDARVQSEERRVLEQQRDRIRAELTEALAAAIDVIAVARAHHMSAKLSAAIAAFDGSYAAAHTPASDSDSTAATSSRAR